MDNSTKKLIQVLDEKDNSEYDEESSSGEEEEFSPFHALLNAQEEDEDEEEDESDDNEEDEQTESEDNSGNQETQKKVVTASKDLLRLEKDYFDGVYHENKFQNEKEFIVKKFLVENKPKREKPNFQDIPRSACNLFFLPF